MVAGGFRHFEFLQIVLPRTIRRSSGRDNGGVRARRDQLFHAEKARIVRLLIEQVRCHAKGGQVEITFRPTGIRALAGEVKA